MPAQGGNDDHPTDHLATSGPHPAPADPTAASAGELRPGPGAGGPRAALPHALRRRLALSSVAVLALMGVVIVGLVKASSFDTRPSSGPASLETVTSPGFVRIDARMAAAFSLPELSDTTRNVSLRSLAGKPLLLNFWSTTCTVCVSEAPALAEAARRLGREVDFVGIDTAESSPTAGLAFVKRYGLDYTMLYDGSMAVAGRYTSGLPVTFFLTATGRIVGENLGAESVASLRQEVRELFGPHRS